jgi:ribosomal protein L4
VYDLLRHQNLLITKAAIEAIEARLGKEGGAS